MIKQQQHAPLKNFTVFKKVLATGYEYDYTHRYTLHYNHDSWTDDH